MPAVLQATDTLKANLYIHIFFKVPSLETPVLQGVSIGVSQDILLNIDLLNLKGLRPNGERLRSMLGEVKCPKQCLAVVAGIKIRSTTDAGPVYIFKYFFSLFLHSGTCTYRSGCISCSFQGYSCGQPAGPV